MIFKFGELALLHEALVALRASKGVSQEKIRSQITDDPKPSYKSRWEASIARLSSLDLAIKELDRLIPLVGEELKRMSALPSNLKTAPVGELKLAPAPPASEKTGNGGK